MGRPKGSKNKNPFPLMTEERKKQISLSLKGRIAWNKGIKTGPLSEEHKEKVRQAALLRPAQSKESIEKSRRARTGKTRSKETRKKMSLSRMGKDPWNKGLTEIYTEETRKKMSDRMLEAYATGRRPLSGYKQGFFKPKFPQKYHGNPTQIVYRSQWELKFMMTLDHNPNIIKWESEETRVGYISPKDSRAHWYYPDFVYHTKNEIVMVEIKPFSQCQQPVRRPGQSDKKLLNETLTYAINQSKWEAATRYCEKRGWKFKILTEKELFGK